MTAVCVASPKEWEIVLKYYNIIENNCVSYPFGSYFCIELLNCEILFFLCGSRKTSSSAALQYIIDHKRPDKIIVIGCCAGISPKLKILDIVIPYRLVQTDTTVKELDNLIRSDFTVDIDISEMRDMYKEPFFSGVLASSDKALVMWNDFLELKENGIDAADTESASIAYVCRANDIPCIVIRGISDFPLDILPDEAASPDSPQIKSFLKNLPLVIKKILDHYLDFFISKN